MGRLKEPFEFIEEHEEHLRELAVRDAMDRVGEVKSFINDLDELRSNVLEDKEMIPDCEYDEELDDAFDELLFKIDGVKLIYEEQLDSFKEVLSSAKDRDF